MDALIEPLQVNERTLALRHIKNLAYSTRLDKALVIVDRGYASYELFKGLIDNKITFLARVKRGFNRDIDMQTKAMGWVTLHKDGQPEIKLRVIKFTLPSGELETLVTLLLDEDLTVEDFKRLYFLRWPVETKFDEVKNKLEIENFTGYSVKTIGQDFYATMYLSNIAASAWWEAQEQVEQERAGKNKQYSYSVNVNHAIGVLKDRLILALTYDDPKRASKEVERILWLLYKRVCPVKPDRSPVRNKSPRKAKFHSNTCSNC